MTDILDAVLALEGEAAPIYRGRAYLWPFAQGGMYWREVDPAKLIERTGMHFAGLYYLEDGEGRPKRGVRELRGALFAEVRGGRVTVRRDQDFWVIEKAPTCERCLGVCQHV